MTNPKAGSEEKNQEDGKANRRCFVHRHKRDSPRFSAEDSTQPPKELYGI